MACWTAWTRTATSTPSPSPRNLKYALRESIELVGNEVVRYMREVRHDKLFDLDDALAGQLGLECLRYMYRLLFLFYIEARPELGYAPVASDAYRKGYSLEHLRDLEMVRLDTPESRDGHYIHHSVERLFQLVRVGFDGSNWGGSEDLLAGVDHGRSNGSEPALRFGFRVRPLDSRLFREGSTPLIDKVKLRNEALQKVIRLMSLTRATSGRGGKGGAGKGRGRGAGKRRRRGRISYAQLGINQLGAVYEALLSYRGFFAEEDLYEVKKAGTAHDDLDAAFFVGAKDLEQYSEDERVHDRDEDGRLKLRVHRKGTFVYRLAGRDRQKSASYYTPESLTRCVVKYSLRELVTDDMPADDILRLTVCEPAMGSAAFLNEAVNQLSEKYLDRKQRELGKRIPHDQYADELQRVRHFITDRNVYGVDLNPVAIELAEVSLWLNCIHEDGHVPWFGYQLACGNSLVGARRQVYPAENVRKAKETRAWAVYLLEDREIDDLDGGRDDNRDFKSLTHGPEPSLHHFDNRSAQANWIAQYLDKMSQRDEPLRGACIVTRTRNERDALADGLGDRGVNVHVLEREDPDPEHDDCVRLATMHRVKGLEFDRVLIASVNRRMVPLSRALRKTGDAAAREVAETGERALVYVAATRAKKELLVLSYGQRSEFLGQDNYASDLFG